MVDLNFTNFDTSKVTYMNSMFKNCISLTHLDLSYFNLENLRDSRYMFEECFTLKEIKFNDNTTTKNLEKMDYMFNGCISLEKINTKIFKENKLTNLNYVFKNCHSLKELDLSYFETKYITELIGSFQKCKSLLNINLTHFDTSKVTRMNFMFQDCNSLTKLDLSYFNLENLKESIGMFFRCDKLKEILFNNDTLAKNLYNKTDMFNACTSLEKINTKIFKESRFRDLNYFFKDCHSLKEIDLSYFDSKYITELIGTFYIVII